MRRLRDDSSLLSSYGSMLESSNSEDCLVMGGHECGWISVCPTGEIQGRSDLRKDRLPVSAGMLSL